MSIGPIAVTKLIAPGETWSTRIAPHGMAGTNQVTLEVSALPPLDIGNRLTYLVQYPHGCLEQTTSSVFPQLFLSSLVWYGGIAWLAFRVGTDWESVKASIETFARDAGIVGLIAAVIAAAIGWWLWRRRKNSAKPLA